MPTKPTLKSDLNPQDKFVATKSVFNITCNSSSSGRVITYNFFKSSATQLSGPRDSPILTINATQTGDFTVHCTVTVDGVTSQASHDVTFTVKGDIQRVHNFLPILNV